MCSAPPPRLKLKQTRTMLRLMTYSNDCNSPLKIKQVMDRLRVKHRLARLATRLNLELLVFPGDIFVSFGLLVQQVVFAACASVELKQDVGCFIFGHSEKVSLLWLNVGVQSRPLILLDEVSGLLHG